MHLLIMGGTRFVGRHAVAAALGSGHDVTLFNRGQSGTSPPGTTEVAGDRNVQADLAALADAGPFDAVIDCCGYYPQQVTWLIDALAGPGQRLEGPRYVYVSSISVYGGIDPPIPPGVTEDGAVVPPVHPETLPDSPYEQYSGLKVACEQVAAYRAARLCTVRAGAIIGPDDYTGRFPYWVSRLTDGGRVLCPGRPDRVVQAIDVRDLGTWLVRLAAEGPDATLHGIGPATTFEGMLLEIADAVGFDGELVWVDDDALLAEGVEEWTDLPLWLAAPHAGMMQASRARAVAAGLDARPLRDTAADVGAWLRSTTDAVIGGMDRQREAELLASLAS